MPNTAMFSFENAVWAKERVFRCRVGVGRGKKGRPKTRTEFEGVYEIEGRGLWVVCRFCGLGVHRGQHALSKLV